MDGAGFTHRTALVGEVRLHYVIAGEGEPLLLVHGFPQTWYEWRKVIPALAKRFTVIAPDYRGAGDSGRPQGGYDKHTMMEDLRGLVHSLGFRQLSVVGHDVGAMIAYRYAAVHPDEVRKVVLMDAPVPGTRQLAEIQANPRAWHVNFHNARDIAEQLVFGREHEYLTYFFKSRLINPDAMTPEEIAVYVRGFAYPGGARAGFELYRAWPTDAKDNAPYLTKKLPMPLMVVAGGASVSGPLMESMMHEMSDSGRMCLIDNSGHWLTEENAPAVEKALLEFL
jgi:pimeloyl-ACP methyl ester carboxylesterase